MSEKDPLIKATPVQDPSRHSHWKSGLFGCCKYGPCNKALLCAWFFPKLMMGQLLQRMKLTWTADPPATSLNYKRTFGIVLLLVMLNGMLYSALGCSEVLPVETDDDEVGLDFVPNPDCPPWKANLFSWWVFAFWLYILVAMIKLRGAIRARYGIAEGCCGFLDDCCTVFWCGCCSSVQMAYQTADYDVEDAACFSTTGLAPGRFGVCPPMVGAANPPPGLGSVLCPDDEDDPSSLPQAVVV